MKHAIAAFLLLASLQGATNLVQNPGGEEGNKTPAGWNLRERGAWSEAGHSGAHALSLKGKPGEKWNVVSSAPFTVKPETYYTLRFWAKVEGQGNFQGGLREIDAAGKTLTYTWQKTRNNVGWIQYTLFVKTRPGAAKGEVFFQTLEDFSGEGWADDISLTEGGDPEGARARTAARKPSTNLLDDPGFELGGKDWGLPSCGKLLPSGGSTGPASLVIDNPDHKKASPIAMLSVEDLQANREYTFSARVKSMAVGEAGPKLKIEFYNAAGENTGGAYSAPMHAPGVWNRVSVKLRAGRDVVRASLLLRMFGTGEAIFDDLDLRFTEPVPFDLEVSPRVAYVGEDLAPRVTFLMNGDDLKSFAGCAVRLAVFDGSSGQPVGKPVAAPADKKEVTLTLALPGKTEATYRLEARLMEAGGAVRHATNDVALVIQRPSLVAAGHYVVDGKPFFPIGAYHVYKVDAEYPLLAEAGFNAVQGSGDHQMARLSNHLGLCKSNGLMYCLPLYGGMKVRANFPYTREKLAAFGEHPALLGFWSMDEPDVWGVTPDELVELRALIGAGTKRLPASSVIFPPSRHFMGQQESMDVIFVDPYPLKKNPEPLTLVRDWIDGAKRAKKPIVSVVQAFETLPHWIKPTPAELENFIYQSLVHGAVGVFYYSLNDPGWNLAKSDLWEKTRQMNREMARLAPVLLSESMRRETWNVRSQPAVDSVCAVVNGETWVLAVNVSDRESALELPLPVGARGKIEAVFGRGTAKLVDGKLLDRVEALGTRVYRVK